MQTCQTTCCAIYDNTDEIWAQHMYDVVVVLVGVVVLHNSTHSVGKSKSSWPDVLTLVAEGQQTQHCIFKQRPARRENNDFLHEARVM